MQSTMRCEIVRVALHGGGGKETAQRVLESAAARLQRDLLVAFPTETVYGLGANALSEDAVRRVFRAKGRPLTDPLIVHVLDWSHAARLVARIHPHSLRIAALLTARFWPGPLTLILPAATETTSETDAVPDVVTAGTGWVGVRSPNHAVARALLEAAKLPIAAPSANRFGHTSPTLAEHVAADFPEEDIMIVDGGACSIGIESTVAKIDGEGMISILRRGAVTTQAISGCLSENGIVAKISVVTRAVKEHVAQEAPGQLLTHYAPDVDAYVVGGNILRQADGQEQGKIESGWLELKDVIMVDYGGAYKDMKEQFKAYRDLSEKRSAEEAASELFKALRWSESVEGAVAVLLPDLSKSKRVETGESQSPQESKAETNAGEDALAVHDRIFRAASGRFCRVDGNEMRVYLGDPFSA
eukprot:TRINITY_DN5039_c0_g1_i3.p1 TRINITY_DN5039_c0_g1~~TRINITY_DN5039_c0_g1_i3.p1  ORF type:complete len:415 (-),score=90.20 TRINITY_DN5039_c0_g1_i3:12-1256(-)